MYREICAYLGLKSGVQAESILSVLHRPVLSGVKGIALEYLLSSAHRPGGFADPIETES